MKLRKTKKYVSSEANEAIEANQAKEAYTGFTPTPQHGVMSRAPTPNEPSFRCISATRYMHYFYSHSQQWLKIHSEMLKQRLVMVWGRAFSTVKLTYKRCVSYLNPAHTPRRHKSTTPCLVSGFTLVEMLVSVAVFSIVMLIAVGALLTMVDANRKAQALNSVMNNLNLAIESMSREIRVGTDYNCGGAGDCPLGDTRLSFISFEGKNITYQYNSSLKHIEVSKESGPPIAITAPEVKIDKFMFYTTGTSPSDSFQPRVVMTIQGTAGVSEKIKTTFNVQTMASQRVPDL